MKINVNKVVPKEEIDDYDRQRMIDAFNLGYDAWIRHIQQKREELYQDEFQKQRKQ